MKPITIDATTISDAWFQLLWEIFERTYKQPVQRGSFEGEQHRLQYPGASIYIAHPDKDIVPVIPVALGIPSPTTLEYIEEYFVGYLMDPTLAENETYTYASRISCDMPKGGTQLERIVNMLKATPLTNHAVLEVATPTDLDICYGKDGKCDPPCLRLIDFKAIPCIGCRGHGKQLWERGDGELFYNDKPCPTCEGKKLMLTVSVYFRSWDLWAGLPSNLGGLELLKQYVAGETGFKNGPMYAYSAGLHIYGYQEELARIRTMKSKKGA